MENLVPLTVVIPLLAAAALLAIEVFVVSHRLADLFSLGVAAATTVLCLILFFSVGSETLVYWFGAWQPRQGVVLGICFSVDAAGALMASLAGVLVTGSFLFSWHYFEAVGALYHSLMMLFLGSMIGFCLTGDLFNMFVFFELMGVAAYALTGYKIEEAGPLQGGFNFVVMNSIGAFFVLAGIAVLYGRTGALNMAQIGRTLAERPADMSVGAALALLFIGFMVKAAIVPFHFWLPDAHAVAPAPVSVLFSGIMVELGLYAIARVYGAVFDPALSASTQVQYLLLTIGTLTVVLGGIMCVLQRHLKRLLAFSTISHGGFVLAALAVPGAAAGALMYVVGHGLVKGTLFLCTGILLHRYKSVDEPQLHGAARKLRSVAVIWFAAGLGLAGALYFATFIGKAMIEADAAQAYKLWLTVVALLASILTGGTVLRAATGIFLGWGKPARLITSAPARGEEERETDSDGKRHPIPWVMWSPPALLVILAVLVAVGPGMVERVQSAGLRLHQPHDIATVLLGTAAPPAPPRAFHITGEAWLTGLLATAGAVALALAGTWWFRLPASMQNLFHVAPFLRRLHCGYVGDYTAWFMLGAAVLLAVLAL